jgi:hypothetical protein
MLQYFDVLNQLMLVGLEYITTLEVYLAVIALIKVKV